MRRFGIFSSIAGRWPYWQVVVGFFLLTCTWLAFVFFLASDVSRRHFMVQSHQVALRAGDLFAHDTLAVLKGLAADPNLQAILSKPISDTHNKDAASLLLESIRVFMKGDALYLLDHLGQACVASIADKSQRGPLGLSYRYRPYFARGLTGLTTVFAAVGRESKTRGIFFAMPVTTPAKKVLGVLVFKMGTQRLDRLLAEADFSVMLVSTEGVVFASNTAGWLLKSITPIEQMDQERMRETHQFGSGTVELIDEQSRRLLDSAQKVKLPLPIDLPGWKLLALMPSPWDFTDGMQLLGWWVMGAGLLLLGGLAFLMIRQNQQIHLADKRAEQLGKFLQIVDQSPTSIVVTNPDGVIEYVNPQFEKITGYSAHELIGAKPNILKSGIHPTEFYEALWSRVRSGKVWQGEFHNRRKDGSTYWESAIIAPVLGPNGAIHNLIGIKTDITLRKEALERLNFYATTDEMTLAMNRRSGLGHLERQMKLAIRHHNPLTVVYADINNLKEINDAYGHAAGDKLILRVVSLLREEIRDSDSLVRMGGDEFLLILPHSDEKQAETVMKRVLSDMNRINSESQEAFSISISYGVMEMSLDETMNQSVSHLIAQADRRMYEQKNVFHGK